MTDLALKFEKIDAESKAGYVKMLGTILKDIEHSITFKIKCERPEIQDVNVFNSITLFYILYHHIGFFRFYFEFFGVFYQIRS